MIAALLLVARAGLGLLLVVAGALKLRDPVAFAQEIANYQLAPGLAPYVAAVLPAIEIVTGLALIALPVTWRRGAALAAAGLLALFTVAVGTAIARGVDISCGCFGAASGGVSGWTLARNVGLLAVAGALIRLDGRPLRR